VEVLQSGGITTEEMKTINEAEEAGVDIVGVHPACGIGTRSRSRLFAVQVAFQRGEALS